MFCLIGGFIIKRDIETEASVHEKTNKRVDVLGKRKNECISRKKKDEKKYNVHVQVFLHMRM